MARTNSKRSRKRGLSPGTLMHVGEKKVEKTRITVIDYDEKNFLEEEVEALEECFPFRDTSTVTWINVDGVHDASVIERLGAYFNLHPLILEDIMTTSQRPKMEDLGDSIYIVLRMVEYDEKKRQITTEQMSVVMGPNYVLSFQETPGDSFDPVRDRIRKAKGRIRKLGPDYLAYALIDSVVDNYFLVLERLGEKIEGLEESLVTEPKRELLHEIHGLKREMIFLRKSVWPLREVLNGLQHAESALIKETTGIFFRDVYDHTIQVMDTVETFRDMLSGMLETIARNHRQRRLDLKLFEIGRVHLPGEGGRPVERARLSLGLSGRRDGEGWDVRPPEGDFFDLKGAVEAYLQSLGGESVTFAEASNRLLVPGQCASVSVDGVVLGLCGCVSVAGAEAFELEATAYVAELDFEALGRAARFAGRYEPLPVYPGTRRDVALIVDEATPYEAVRRAIELVPEPILRGYRLFDLYRGEQVGAGRKSLALAFEYRSDTGTLTDREVEKAHARIKKALIDRLKCEIRES